MEARPGEIYIDEPMPDELRLMVCHERHDGLLHVPSGILCASGIEYVSRAAKVVTNHGRDSHLFTSATIPPGTYLVDAYIRVVGEEVEAAFERELGPEYWREDTLKPLGFIAILFSVILLVLALLAGNFTPQSPPQAQARDRVAESGERLVDGVVDHLLDEVDRALVKPVDADIWESPNGGTAPGAWLFRFSIALLAGGLAAIFAGRPRSADYSSRKTAIEMRFPTYVFVLRRAVDDDVARCRGLRLDYY